MCVVFTKTITDYRAKYFGKAHMNNYTWTWSQVYSRDDNIIELRRYEQEHPGNVVPNSEFIPPHREESRHEEQQQIPPHVTRVLWNTALEVSRIYTCPVCMEFMTAETFSMTGSGDELCTTCF